MHKRERIERSISGEATDRPPIALWRHWQGDDQRAADHAEAIGQFQSQWDWDFVCVAPASNFSVTSYGISDSWQGNLLGTRDIAKPVIQESAGWTELKPLDILRGDTAKQLECLRILGERFIPEQTPFLAIVYSPLAQARRLAGDVTLVRHLRQHPERLKTGLNVLTENTLRYLEALRRTGVSGIYYVVEHAHYDALSKAEYEQFGKVYDAKVLSSVEKPLWLRLLYAQGNHVMFDALASLPVHAINWQSSTAQPSLEDARSQFAGALMGGLDSHQHLHNGTPSQIRDLARHAQRLTGGRRFILSCNGASMITTPLSHWRATREAFNEARL